MPYDAFGNFTRDFNFTADKVAGIKIQSVRVDGECDNFATGFNEVLLRNGVVPVAGNLKMGNNSITGIATGSAGTPALSFAGDVTTGLFQPAVSELSVAIAGAEIVRIAAAGLGVTGALGATGDITAGGLVHTGDGVSFAAVEVPSSDANTLDDYEEGSWTPSLTGDTGSSGQAYAVQVGQYIKVGRKVTLSGSITLTTKGVLTGTFACIAGLPFLPDSSATVTIGGLVVEAGITPHYSSSVYHDHGSNFAYLQLRTSLSNTRTLALLADISNGAKITFTWTYFAAN